MRINYVKMIAICVLVVGIVIGLDTGFAQTLRLSGLVHVENLGDQPLTEARWAGTKGRSLRLEGFAVNLSPPTPGLALEYMCHLEGQGDTPWMPGGSFCGTRGQDRRLEGFAIRLTGAQARNYDIYYACHLETRGDTGPVMNGAFCGTRGQSLRVEALEVAVVVKGLLLVPQIGVNTAQQGIVLGTSPNLGNPVPIPRTASLLANVECVDYAHPVSDARSPLGFRCECSTGFATVPGGPADAWGNPGGNCISLQPNPGGLPPLPIPRPTPTPPGPTTPDPPMCMAGQQGSLSWVKCAYYLVIYSKLINECNNEISAACGHGDCPYCLKYLNDLGATDFSGAQMICVRKKDPNAWSKLMSSCTNASWSHVTNRR